MASKLSPRQQAQLAWLDQLPQPLERLNKIIELMAVGQAEDTQLRNTRKLVDQLKAQASGIGLAALGDSFGYMGAILRRTGGEQVRARGLRELLSGVKINAEGARRAASTPEIPEDEVETTEKPK